MFTVIYENLKRIFEKIRGDLREVFEKNVEKAKNLRIFEKNKIKKLVKL